VEFNQLTDNDLHVIAESLNFSVWRVRDYPHCKYEDKRMSLRPIEEARDKVRRLIAARQEGQHGR